MSEKFNKKAYLSKKACERLLTRIIMDDKVKAEEQCIDEVMIDYKSRVENSLFELSALGIMNVNRAKQAILQLNLKEYE